MNALRIIAFILSTAAAIIKVFATSRSRRRNH